MSTFDGVVKEYPLISIDNFVEDSKNFQSTVFFLSHCHTDHMNGLKDQKFFQLLESRGFSHIYMSDVSEHLLKNDDIFSHLSKYLISLPIEQPTLIDVYDEYGVICSRIVVTLLTAGHCPGSVMFLIEGNNGRVLYTGDFRLPVGGSARLLNLHDKMGRLKPLCSLYIDTTFCSEKCMYIPTREQCMVEILKLVKEWLAKGPDYIVRFICPAQYNYEFVFVEIFKELGEKTHVFENKLKKYKGIKIIEDAVTSVPTEARVHACISGFSYDFKEILYINESPCGYHTEDFKPIKVRLIKPSAIFFQRNKYSDLSTFDHSTNVHRVCFSTHSSLDEIRDMVKYLKPKRVYPNVVAQGTTVEQILHLIDSPYWDYPDSLSPLGPLENDPNQGESIPSSNSLPFYDDCYKIPHQSPILDEFSTNHDGPPESVEEASNTSFLHNDKGPLHDIEVPIPLNTISVTLNNNNAPSNDSITPLIKPNCDNTSPVKWECPILSSDDENYNPNCSFDSSKDKSDSDVYATSEEQNLAELMEECFSPMKPKLPKSVPPADHISISIEKHNSFSYSNLSESEQPVFPSNESAKKHKSFSNVSAIASKAELPVKERNFSSVICCEPEKLLASQESRSICNTNSEHKSPESERVSTNSKNASCIDTQNQCDIGDSKLTFDSIVQCNRRTNPTMNLVKSSPSHKKIFISKQANCDKFESRSSAFQSQYEIQILGQDISTNSAESITKKCCKHSKLSHSKQANCDKFESRSSAFQSQYEIQILGQDISTNSAESITKKCCKHSKLSHSKQANCDKFESRSSAFQSQYEIQILGQDISTNSAESITKKCCKHSELSHSKQANSDKFENESHSFQLHKIQMVGEPSWRQSKLLDINNLNSNTFDSKVVFSQNSKQGVEITMKELNVFKKDDPTNISNTSPYLSDTIEHSKSSIKEIVSERNCLKKSSVPLYVHIFDNSKTLNKQTTFKDTQVSNSIMQNVARNNNTIKSTQKRKSLSSKREFFVEESQTLSVVGVSDNMMTSSKLFPPCLPYFSKKVHDPFASKYEKYLIKCQKKEPVADHSQFFHDDDISILSCKNKCDKDIQIIDLSSDDYDSEVELFNCTELDLKKTLPVQSEKTIESEIKDASTADSVEEEDSPSLLVPTKRRNEVTVTASCGRLDSGKKRKSADKDNFIAKKSPHVDFSSACDIDTDVESTPEDLLPFSLSPVSNYFKKILGSETKSEQTK